MGKLLREAAGKSMHRGRRPDHYARLAHPTNVANAPGVIARGAGEKIDKAEQCFWAIAKEKPTGSGKNPLALAPRGPWVVISDFWLRMIKRRHGFKADSTTGF